MMLILHKATFDGLLINAFDLLLPDAPSLQSIFLCFSHFFVALLKVQTWLAVGLGDRACKRIHGVLLTNNDGYVLF